MIAALMEDYGAPLRLAEVAEPRPEPGAALVRVAACGVCRSDWHAWSGDWRWRMHLSFPHVLGHELSGQVAAVGEGVEKFRPGDRVMVPFHLPCGTCELCAAGWTNRCARYTSIGFQLPGGFAEFVSIPLADASLVPLPDAVPYADAAALGCRFMSAWHGLTDRARVAPGEWVAVFGVGGLGLATVQVAVSRGARVVAVDLRAENLEMARREGAEHVLEAGESAAQAVREMTGGGADVAVDAVGEADTCLPALHSLRAGGRLLRLGLTGAEARGSMELPVDHLTKQELQIVGSLGCPRPGLDALVREVAEGRLRPGRLVSRMAPLSGVNDSLEAMTRYRTAGMHLVVPPGSPAA